MGASPVPRALPDSYQPLRFLLNTIAQDFPTKWNWGYFSPLPLIFQWQPSGNRTLFTVGSKALSGLQSHPTHMYLVPWLQSAPIFSAPASKLLALPGTHQAWRTFRLFLMHHLLLSVCSVTSPFETGQPPACDSHPTSASQNAGAAGQSQHTWLSFFGVFCFWLQFICTFSSSPAFHYLFKTTPAPSSAVRLHFPFFPIACVQSNTALSLSIKKK